MIHYVETRKRAASSVTGRQAVTADIMRHFHARQWVGPALVVTDTPQHTLTACRRQWLNLSRLVQKRRASTLDADKILRHTHTITHMQHLFFGYAEAPAQPDDAVYFFSPDALGDIPAGCMTVYIIEPLDPEILAALAASLPEGALVVTYYPLDDTGDLQPKANLEAAVERTWDDMCTFLAAHDISPSQLHPLGTTAHNLDNTLDILLGASRQFFTLAEAFHRAVALSRPLRLNATTQTQYDTITLLAHRVNALSPGRYTDEFLESFLDDTYTLYDIERLLARPAPLLAHLRSS
jgi:hypothetical protein